MTQASRRRRTGPPRQHAPATVLILPVVPIARGVDLARQFCAGHRSDVLHVGCLHPRCAELVEAAQRDHDKEHP